MFYFRNRDIFRHINYIFCLSRKRMQNVLYLLIYRFQVAKTIKYHYTIDAVYAWLHFNLQIRANLTLVHSSRQEET